MNGSLWRKYGGLFLLALITLCAFNWNLPVTDPVESNYALTAKEMVLAGNWISPQIYGHYWFDKPIFAYWLLEISYALFGFGDFASRLPGAVMGAATVVMTGVLGECFWRRKDAYWYSGLFLLTTFAFWVLSRGVVTDPALLLWTAVTMYGAYRGLTENSRRCMMLAYAGAGLAVLTKGPVGLVLPGLILLVWLAVTPDARRWKRLFDPAGIAVFFLVAAPWYVTMYMTHGADFIRGFLGLHNITRATVSEHPEDNHWYYYLLILPLSTLPWTPLALREIVRARWETSAAYRFCVVWIVVTVLFYTAMATKYITYTYIAILPLVLLAVRAWLYAVDSGRNKYDAWLTAPAFFMTALYLGGMAYLNRMLIGLAAVLLIFFAYTLWRSRRSGSRAGLFARVAWMLVIASLLLTAEGLPSVLRDRSTEELASAWAAEPGVHYCYRSYTTSFPFYTGIVPIFADRNEEKNEVWAGKYTMPQVTKEEFVAALKGHEQVTLLVPRSQRKHLANEPYAPLLQLKERFHSGDIYVNTASLRSSTEE